jgi:carboxypeptidase PM20D1
MGNAVTKFSLWKRHDNIIGKRRHLSARHILRSLVTTAATCSCMLGGTVAHAKSDDYREEARDIYTHMIAFPTVAGKGQVPLLVQWIKQRLSNQGVAESDIVILPHKETAAMLVRVRGRDTKAKPILISAHLDVVDAKSQDWGSDPFKLVERDGKFYGRGSFDNKAGATALVSAILRLSRDPYRLRRDVIFAFVGDEETALETTAAIVQHDWVKGAELAINTDAGYGLESQQDKPAIYFVQGAEKVYASFELTTHNAGGHSSRPKMDNAIFDLGDVIAKLRSFRSPVISNTLSRAYLASAAQISTGPLADALKGFSAHPQEGPDAELLAKYPEYVGVTRTTCVPTLVRGGHAENALPQSATVTINCRIFPGESLALIQQRLTDHMDDPAIEIRSLYPDFSSPVSELTSEVADAIKASIRKHHPGALVAPYLESGATDGRIYRGAGIPTFGTAGHFYPSSAANLHGKDENIPVAAFYQEVDHVYDLARTLGDM